MVERNTPLTIAIVGGGLSGALVATHLLQTATSPLQIKLIERRPKLGRGVAYSTHSDCHLLNVPAGKMSAFPNDPDHFLRWMQTYQSSTYAVRADTFLPRKLYGEYIQAVLDNAEATCSPQVHLHRLNDEVIAIQPEAKGASLQLSSGLAVSADHIVLALGNLPPNPPSVSDSSFYSSRRYISSAWSHPGLSSLSPDEPVLIIGSGMTMLDLVVDLHKQGHQGKIAVISRHGLLPQPHHPTDTYPSFLKAEQAPRTMRLLMQRIRQEVQLAAVAGYDWRSVIDSLRPTTQVLWQALPLKEQQRFLRHVRPYWEILRHRAAPAIADTITDMLHSKQLVVYAGRIQSYQEDSTGVNVVIRQRNLTEPTTLHVGAVINCTGPSANYHKGQHPFVKSLLSAGLIRPDALALGLDTASNGALLRTDGTASNFLYTLGSPRKGTLWETTAAREIREQAMELAQELLHLQTEQSRSLVALALSR